MHFRKLRGENENAIHVQAYLFMVLELQTHHPAASTGRGLCGVVPKGLLKTFLGSLYKEGAKTTSGTLVYRFERRTAREKKKSFLPKTLCPQFRM